MAPLLAPWLLLSALAQPAEPWAQARAAERQGRAQDEEQACKAVLAEPSDGASQEACEARLQWLDARRDPDGRLRGLQALLDLLHHRAGADDPDALEAGLHAIRDDPQVGVRVRQEAALILCRRALAADAAPDQLLRLTEPLWLELRAEEGDEGLRRSVADLHARALTRAGRSEEAAEVEASLAHLRSARPAEGPALDRRLRLQDRLRWGSWLSLGACALLGLPPLMRRPWPRAWPGGLLPLAVVATGMAALVALSGGAEAGLILRLGLGLGALHLVAGPALLASQPGPRRLLLRVSLAGATLSLSYLILDHAGLTQGLLP